MEQQQSNNEVNKVAPQVVVSETADPTKSNITEEAIQAAASLFFAHARAVRNSKLSRGSVLRAFDFAINRGLTTRKVKLLSKDEINLANLIGSVLDNRLMMMAYSTDQANKIEAEKEQEKGENDGQA